jgi:adenylate kinase
MFAQHLDIDGSSMIKCTFFILNIFIFCISAQFNFVLIGPPGAGKGTFSSYMVKKYGYHQICPGDILRAHIKNNTPLGQVIKPIVQNGEDVDPAIVYKIIAEEINYCLERNIQFIIDGFPRNRATCDFFVGLLAKKNISSAVAFVHFKIDLQTCFERVSNRLICLGCGNIFNTITNQPKAEMRCDMCQDILHVRIADSPDITLKRLDSYKSATEPLIDTIKERFVVLTIDATQSLRDCLKAYDAFIIQP